MTPLHVPLTRPYTGVEEASALAAVLESGWLTQGRSVADFETTVAECVGAKHGVACGSCTAALHVALLVHGIGPGDEVVIPSYTWIATANVVRMVGARPVFADIDPATFNVTPDTVTEVLTSRTRALMPVHQFGLPADMDGIMAVARRWGLIVIEDAACALGSAYKGRPVGGLGNLACFSFHPRKVITTGEGGLLVTNDRSLAERARVLINHGASVSDRAKHEAKTVEAVRAEEFHVIGFNYRMTNLQGALGVIQMGRLPELLAQRRWRAQRYDDAFRQMPYVIAPSVPAYATPNWQSYAIRIADNSPVSRDHVAQRLLDAGIGCRPGYMACHVEPLYRHPNSDLVNTEKALGSVLILPLYPQMTDEEQGAVIEHLRESWS